MGIVLKQTITNTITTFIGFGFGALNTLFLYTNILEPSYYGLVTFILASGAILMPIMSAGAHNSMVKFYSAQDNKDKNGFLTLILLAPLMIILPLTLLVWLFYDSIGDFLSIQNSLVKDYIWYLFLVGLSLAYFEVFYAWGKVHLKSVFGNFLKEVFARVCATVLLVLLYLEMISLDFFYQALVGVYLLRTLMMKLYAYSLQRPVLNFNFFINQSNFSIIHNSRH